MGLPGYVTVDVQNASIFAAYEGKDVKSADAPQIYRIENGMKRVYPSEAIFFKHGGRFGTDRTWILISNTLLNSIPTGSPMV